MKTIGLIGGMSWESTETYYRLINQGVKEALGGLHSGKILLNSLEGLCDFLIPKIFNDRPNTPMSFHHLLMVAKALKRGSALNFICHLNKYFFLFPLCWVIKDMSKLFKEGNIFGLFIKRPMAVLLFLGT